MSKKKNKKKFTLKGKGAMLVGAIVFLMMFIGCVVLTGKYTKEYFDSKNYASTTAYVVGEVKTNRITDKDEYGNVKAVHEYYDYKYVFEVDGKEYTGEKNNVEEYYGDSFTVLYDENNPSKFVIGDEASFPVILFVASVFVFAIFGYTVYRIITD